MNPPFIPQNVIFLRWIIAIKVIQEHGHEFGLKSAGDKDVFGSFLSEVLGIGHMTHYVQLHVSNVDNVYGSIYVAKFKWQCNLFVIIRSVDQQRNSLPKTLMSISNRIHWG